METTPETVVEETPPESVTDPAPEETPADPEPEMITVEEANRQSGRIAKSARKEATDALDIYKAEVAPQLAKLKADEETKTEATREEMTEVDRLKAEITDRDKVIVEKDSAIAARDAAITLTGQQRRTDEINAAITAEAPQLLTVQRDHIVRQFADATDLDIAQVTEAAKAAQAEVAALMQAPGMSREIGSPGSPAVEPEPAEDAAYLELVERSEAEGPDGDKAIGELQKAVLSDKPFA